MRVRTLEIRWHDSKPINSCDFQPLPPKKARPTSEKDFTAQSYRLVTAGEDNNVRVWMVYPNILPPIVVANASGTAAHQATHAPTPHAPRVEYLSTLAKHQAPVNVVRFSPDGELIASAGDDGMVIIWSPSNTAPNVAYGSEPDTNSYEKEYWKARTPFRCTTMQVYDLAWSPTGEYVITGSTDNTARIFSASDGKCMREIAEHSHFVQGVAWDPLNEYIATQSSDRAVHVYSVSTNHATGVFDAHAVGRNTKMAVSSSRTPSAGVGRKRHRSTRKESATSDAESGIASDRDEVYPPPPPVSMPMTPAPSIASTPSASNAVFLPPPSERTMSRRSSFSSVAPASPAPSHYSTSHRGRSPSPMPPLPAIRAPPSPQMMAQSRLYGDESFTNFYRRLTFSPDGALLLTPSGHFEDPSNISAFMLNESSRGRRGHPADSIFSDPTSASSVYIYSRANFARPPIAQLPGHKKASVAVKFSPVLYSLRPGVTGPQAPPEPWTVNIAVERGSEDQVDIDMVGPIPTPASAPPGAETHLQRTRRSESRGQSRVAPSPSLQTPHPSQTLPSPALSAVDGLPQTPAKKSETASQRSEANSQNSQPVSQTSAASGRKSATPSTSITNNGAQTGSVFALPYRMLFAVATMDTITIHDTQQASPIALLTKLHYDEFTDMAWSPDGQCLMLTSRDGYCTIVIFDQVLPAHHVQQHSLQLQSMAFAHQYEQTHHGPGNLHSHSHSQTLASGSMSTHGTPLPTPSKRNAPLPPLERPVSSAGTSAGMPPEFGKSVAPEFAESASSTAASGSSAETDVLKREPEASSATEPPKKKRRVALTRVNDALS